MRTLNTLRNGIVGMFSQLIILVTSFILRAIFIKTLGQEYLGLNGLFMDIFSILSVTELGLGSAITFALYKPLFENDLDKISGLMNLYRKAYRVIGVVIFIFSIFLIPFLQIFIKDYTLDLQYIRIVFLLFAINATLSYFLSYSRLLLFAKQQNYIVLSIDFIAKLVLSLLQAIVLIKTKNFLLYLSLLFAYNIISNLFIRHFALKENPYLKNTNTKLDAATKASIINSLKYLSLSSIISIGVLGTDRIIISSLIGISILGVYSNYSLIIQSVQNLFINLLNGVVASIGNLLAEGNQEKILRIFKVYNFIYFLVASFTSVALYHLLSFFIGDIWLSKSYVMDESIIVIIVINSYLHLLRQPVWQFQSTAGIFKHYIPFSIVEFVINLSVSIYGAMNWGIIGVFIGTLSAYVISWIGQAYILNKHVIKSKIRLFYGTQVLYFALTLFYVGLSSLILNYIVLKYAVLQFLVNGMLITFITFGINYLIFRKDESFIYLKESVFTQLIQRLKRI